MRIGTTELLLIFGIALIVFGPSKLPEIGKSLGKTINEFKSEANKATNEINEVIKDDPNDKKEQ